MNDLKQQFNKLLESYNKAEEYFKTNYSIKAEERFKELLRELSKLLNTMDNHQIKYTDDEITGGFKL